MPSTLADRLNELIDNRANGQSHAAVARASGIDRVTLRLIVSGENLNPHRHTVAKVAHYLGGDTDWLMTGEGEPPSDDEKRPVDEQIRILRMQIEQLTQRFNKELAALELLKVMMNDESPPTR